MGCGVNLTGFLILTPLLKSCINMCKYLVPLYLGFLLQSWEALVMVRRPIRRKGWREQLQQLPTPMVGLLYLS